MTENEAEVLAELEALANETGGQCIGFKPLDFGGADGSHHAQTTIRMCRKGWVERSFGLGFGIPKPNGAARGSCRYRITPQGRQALANHRLQLSAVRSAEAQAHAKLAARRALLRAKVKETVS